MIRRPLFLVLAVFALSGLLLGFMFLQARADPIVRRATLRLSSWPSGAPPLNVALISDIHIGNAAMDADRLSRIVGQVDALHPDLVLIAGDFIAGHDRHGAAKQESALRSSLAGLHAPLGVVAVLGNHDHWTGPAVVQRALSAVGAVSLSNQAIVRGPLVIVGLDDPYSALANVGAALRSSRGLRGAPLWLAHSPDIIGRLPTGATLLAGHTHCGQVVLPLIGPVLPVAELRHTCRIIHENGRTIVVSAGLGTSGEPVRFGAPPDLWLLTVGP